MPDKPKTLEEAYSMSPPSELEQRLAEQRKPGYIPIGWERWTLDSLPESDPRKQAAKQLAVNGQLTEEALRDLFKQ